MDAVGRDVLARGDSVPHFVVTTLDGRCVSYAAIWQQKMLLLVVLPAEETASARKYFAALSAQRQMLEADDVAFVVTRDRVAGVSVSAVFIADQWGEVAFAVEKEDPADLPQPGELAEWLDFLRNRCPECEGEAR
jgi:hypothetical protein